MSVQAVAVKRATRILDALGATYDIKLPDGTKYGRKRRRGAPENDFTSTGYAEKVKGMKPGDTAKFEFNGYDAERFRGTIAAKASQMFGKQSAITHIDRKTGTIEILRVK